MTDETPASADTPAPDARAAEPARVESPRSGNGAAWAVAALALVAAAAGAYLGWQQRDLSRAQEALQKTQAAQQAGGEQLRDELTKQRERLGDLDAGQRDQARKLSAAEERALETRAALEKLYAEIRSGRDLLPAEEAAFLVRHAQYALHLVRDPATALRALELAEARLREHGDPKWLPAREALNGVLAKLRAQAPADLTGVTARLRALASGVERLPTLPARGAGPASTPASERAGWREFLGALWEDLKSLVRIRRVDDKLPLIAPEQRYFLAQNLVLMLNSAQWAALRGDAETYRRNLEAARDWLGAYYDAAQPPVVEAQGELKALIAVPLSLEPPDLAPLLSTLRKGSAR